MDASALNEREGVNQPNPISQKHVERIRALRKQKQSVAVLLEGILQSDITQLSRGITMVESQLPEHQLLAQELIQACLPHANRSLRIGITGVPGVGKSTFIEAFGKYLTGKGKRVAVLAIDPSSRVSHGSILGDKTRMEELVKEPLAYIRPSAAGDSLGGVAQKTREAIVLCEAAGFEIIIVETVGVGQSETAVQRMTDFFLLLQLAGAGDELQGIKRGIMEMADMMVINKADGDNLKRAQSAKGDFQRALHMFPPKASEWTPKVSLCSALHHQGIETVWEGIEAYAQLTRENHYFEQNRHEQNLYWLFESVETQLKIRFYEHPQVKQQLTEMKKAVQSGLLSPFAAAELLLKAYGS